MNRRGRVVRDRRIKRIRLLVRLHCAPPRGGVNQQPRETRGLGGRLSENPSCRADARRVGLIASPRASLWSFALSLSPWVSPMNTKQLIASLIALAGVAAAAYSIASFTGGEKPGARLGALSAAARDAGGLGDDAPELAALRGTGAGAQGEPAPGEAPEGAADDASNEPDPGAETPTFASVATPEAIAELGANLEARVESQAAAMPEVSALGAAPAAQLGKSLRTLVEPAIAGSQNKVIEALKALGGLSPEEQAARSSQTPQSPPPGMEAPRGGEARIGAPPGGQGARRSPIPGGPLAAILKGASIDWSRARVLPVYINGEDRERAREGMGEVGGALGASGSVIPGTQAAPGAPGSAPGSSAGSPPPGAGQREERRAVMKMMSRGAFPEAEDYRNNKMNVVEVRAPLLLAGEEPPARADALEIGIDMAWNPSAQQWQPVGTKLYPNDPKYAMKVQSLMRAAMGPPGG